MKNLYEITGSITDINTLLVNRAEYEALATDAARYQWLMSNAYVGIAPHPKPHEVWCLRLPNPSNCANLDAAIDAAMKKPVVDAEKASKPRYVLRTCEECWGVGESEKYGYDDYSCGFCRDCMGTGKVAILKEST